jgi:hypothetical protein
VSTFIQHKAYVCVFNFFVVVAAALSVCQTLEFALDDMDPFVFCLARKREENRLRKAFADLVPYSMCHVLNPLPQPRPPLICDRVCVLTTRHWQSSYAKSSTSKALTRGVPGSTAFQHVLMSDAPSELDELLLDERVVATLLKNQDLFAYLHITDQHCPVQPYGPSDPAAAVAAASLASSSSDPVAAAAAAAASPMGSAQTSFAPRKVLRLKLWLPSSGADADWARLARLTELALTLVDRVASLRLPLPTLNRGREARQLVAKRFRKTLQEQQQEDAARRREEKRAKEAELVATMTPEQQRRWEDKQAKERAKKMGAGPRVKVSKH